MDQTKSKNARERAPKNVQDILAARAELRRQYYAERINEYDAAEYVSGGPVQREGFPTHERVQQWRREDAACRAKERAIQNAAPCRRST